ncbi:MAG: aminodeoxychorismate/anthranilate synthase component II [Firmicutes bacterium]|nr:aminodeoxychorismate/anthranilate synthase component II [Bacillota bacterium]
MILVIDNYDSFTYNLVQLVGNLAGSREIRVCRNDALTLFDLEELQPERIIISPGPGRPKDAGISRDVVKHFAGKVPILGVCLGHQAIGEVFGAKLVAAPSLFHGKASEIRHNKSGVFAGLPNPFIAGRYHSLVLSPNNFPECLEITAWTCAGEVMGIRHREFPVEGVQFHPESVLTENGYRLIENFLR